MYQATLGYKSQGASVKSFVTILAGVLPLLSRVLKTLVT